MNDRYTWADSRERIQIDRFLMSNGWLDECDSVTKELGREVTSNYLPIILGLVSTSSLGSLAFQACEYVGKTSVLASPYSPLGGIWKVQGTQVIENVMTKWGNLERLKGC